MSSTQLKQVIEELKDLKLDAPSMDELRAGFASFMSRYSYDPSITSEPVTIGEMKAEWLVAPGADHSRAILYLHGGGYVIGSIETHRALAARLSQASGARVLLIDYRLAPEHPHPAAVEDSVAAYRWLLGWESARKRSRSRAIRPAVD
ncbi:MAG TPA: alpha/beta hydrolase fold domain-containing protein [Candidatus Binataceae bacterium]|nr:alpha/beta hydrolase fold domain-containing protein [Candidatus Binataceae bacterium]